jgi:phage gp36-like protein
MAFIDKSDLLSYIRQNKLDDITDFDDNKLDAAIDDMTAYMAGFLSARYDTSAIFMATGANRDPVIKMYMCDLVLYHLHKLINWRKIPEFRKERYQEAKEWLQDVQGGLVNPPGLPIPTDGSLDYIKFGGNPKLDNNY